jgi:hypothetical protein
MEPEPEVRSILGKRPRKSAVQKAFETTPEDEAKLVAELSADIISMLPEVGPDAVKFVDGPFFFVDTHGEMTTDEIQLVNQVLTKYSTATCGNPVPNMGTLNFKNILLALFPLAENRIPAGEILQFVLERIYRGHVDPNTTRDMIIRRNEFSNEQNYRKDAKEHEESHDESRKFYPLQPLFIPENPFTITIKESTFFNKNYEVQKAPDYLPTYDASGELMLDETGTPEVILDPEYPFSCGVYMINNYIPKYPSGTNILAHADFQQFIMTKYHGLNLETSFQSEEDLKNNNPTIVVKNFTLLDIIEFINQECEHPPPHILCADDSCGGFSPHISHRDVRMHRNQQTKKARGYGGSRRKRRIRKSISRRKRRIRKSTSHRKRRIRKSISHRK